jgi:hypothetical protein
MAPVGSGWDITRAGAPLGYARYHGRIGEEGLTSAAGEREAVGSTGGMEVWDHRVSRTRSGPHHLSDTRITVCPYRVLAIHPTGLNTDNQTP